MENDLDLTAARESTFREILDTLAHLRAALPLLRSVVPKEEIPQIDSLGDAIVEAEEALRSVDRTVDRLFQLLAETPALHRHASLHRPA